MEIIGYVGALLMGLSLGLIGGGGSILTVPILVYLFLLDGVTATSYSLFIVGVTSLFGSASHFRQGNVHVRAVLLFGLPSLVSVYLTRHFVVPLIPETLFVIGDFTLTKSVFLLVLFAVVMLLASWSMIRLQPASHAEASAALTVKPAALLPEGLLVGCLTGLLGAGGGFLIVPALVMAARLGIKQAIGTSLVIISLNALVGFAGSLHWENRIDWPFLAVFSAVSLAGTLLGSWLSSRISGAKLKPAFGWFVLAMGVYILVRELT
ncbi:MAG: sulfite exporter TauE/SafE family protein [Cytophagales bacterium]|nr:sulfite exporter TauE/SafE family protein [Cytophagales bacterium]